MGLRPAIALRSGGPLRRVALALAGAAFVLAAHPAAADHRSGGGHGGFHGGFHGGGHGAFHHFHSFVFVGAGVGYPYYSPAYAYPGYYPPPPVYVSPTECYQPPVPRAPGVADLYTCSGQYVGPIAVP